MSFVQKHPGAMTAHFLAMVRQKVKRAAGIVKNSSDLRDINLCSWMSAGSSSLSDVRDVREVTTLCHVMDAINRDDISTAMDTLALRIQSVIRAKSKGGSWEKSSKMELIPEQGVEMVPSGLTGLLS